MFSTLSTGNITWVMLNWLITKFHCVVFVVSSLFYINFYHWFIGYVFVFASLLRLGLDIHCTYSLVVSLCILVVVYHLGSVTIWCFTLYKLFLTVLFWNRKLCWMCGTLLQNYRILSPWRGSTLKNWGKSWSLTQFWMTK